MAQGRIIKVPTEGEIEEIVIDAWEYPGLNQALFGDSSVYFEMVKAVTLKQYNDTKVNEFVTMLVDEEGRLKLLEPNVRAGYLYRADIIAGDAFLLGVKVVDTDEGPDYEFGPLPDDFTLQYAKDLITYSATRPWFFSE